MESDLPGNDDPRRSAPRSIVVLGLPHDVDVEARTIWAHTRPGAGDR